MFDREAPTGSLWTSVSAPAVGRVDTFHPARETRLRRRCAGRDATIDESYKTFYLKNLAPMYRGDCAHVPLRRFPSYVLRAGDRTDAGLEGIAEGAALGGDERFRFTCDARKVIELWETPES